MIMELTTTSLGLAMGLGSASVLTGTSSSMDGIRKFFLSEKSDIDDILQNSRDFEAEYGIDEKLGSDDDITPKPSNDNGSEDTSATGILGSVVSGATVLGTEAVKSWFNYKYLVIALGVAVVYKLITGKSFGGNRI